MYIKIINLKVYKLLSYDILLINI